MRFGGQGWIRTSVRLHGQIYSLLPLTTRPPVPRYFDFSASPKSGRQAMAKARESVNPVRHVR
jgi:hypothetical protein